MELRLLVAVAGILVGLVIVLTGVRLLDVGDAPPAPQRGSRTGSGGRAFIVSGAVFVVTGVMLITLGVRAIGQAQHEIMTMVKPTSTLRLDTPGDPAQDRSPDRRERDRLR